MKWDFAEGSWKQMKGKVRKRWGKLTDDELEQVKGDRDQMIGLIQRKYSIGREEAEKQVDEWRARLSA